jgi:methylglyoxal synthase
VRACDVHDIPCATNEATGRMLLLHLRSLQSAG